MAHPYFHSLSSVRNFGGQESDYSAIHNWLDATKAHFADFRHRAIRHHVEAIPILELELRKVDVINSDGATVPLRKIAEQHIVEDCLSLVTVEDWFRDARISPRLRGLNRDFNPTKGWGGVPGDYLPIHRFFREFNPAQFHHSQGIFQIEAILGTTIPNSDGRRIPVRAACEEFLRAKYGRIPTLIDWVSTITPRHWMIKTQKIESSLI